jgi:hypothetical protein
LALISVELANMFAAHAHSAHIVGYMTPMLLIVTYILAFFFIQYERLSGLRSSGLLFCFWAFLLLDLLIIVRSKVFLNSPKKVKEKKEKKRRVLLLILFVTFKLFFFF